jgi:hypothetical protein
MPERLGLLRHQETALKGGKSASVSRSGGENATEKEMGITPFGFKPHL